MLVHLFCLLLHPELSTECPITFQHTLGHPVNNKYLRALLCVTIRHLFTPTDSNFAPAIRAMIVVVMKCATLKLVLELLRLNQLMIN